MLLSLIIRNLQVIHPWKFIHHLSLPKNLSQRLSWTPTVSHLSPTLHVAPAPAFNQMVDHCLSDTNIQMFMWHKHTSNASLFCSKHRVLQIFTSLSVSLSVTTPPLQPSAISSNQEMFSKCLSNKWFRKRSFQNLVACNDLSYCIFLHPERKAPDYPSAVFSYCK